MALCDQEGSRQAAIEQAYQIYLDYIIEGADFELDETIVVHQLAQGYDYSSQRIKFKIDETLF